MVAVVGRDLAEEKGGVELKLKRNLHFKYMFLFQK